MCESNAYIVRNGTEELLMESVGLVRQETESVLLKSIFGETANVYARIKEMDLTGHRIVLEEMGLVE